MLAEGLATYLDSEGIGTLDDDLFIRLMPDTPDNVICIYDEPGATPTEAQNYDVDVFGSQFLLRGSYGWVKVRIFEIHRRLPGLSGTFDGIEVQSTHIQTEPSFVENDSDGRALYTIHYEHYCNIGNNINRTTT